MIIQRLCSGGFSAKSRLLDMFRDERGEVNIIAIILIIIVVIALVAVFRNGIMEVVNGLFDQIKDSLGL